MKWVLSRATAAFALALLLAACGSEVASEPGGSAPRVDVQVTLWPEGRQGESLTASLTCDREGGSHPDAVAACAALEEEARALEPLPSDAVCTQIYGGPEEAEIEGEIDGRRISAGLSRQNGCEIDRWERLAPVLAVRS